MLPYILQYLHSVADTLVASLIAFHMPTSF